MRTYVSPTIAFERGITQKNSERGVVILVVTYADDIFQVLSEQEM
jgi:phage terminase large subunit-like protein